MNALSVLYAGDVKTPAFKKVFSDGSGDLSCAFSLSLRAASSFSGVTKLLLLTSESAECMLSTLKPLPDMPCQIEIVQHDTWNIKTLLELIANKAEGFDFVYFAFADCPFLDAGLAKRLAVRHCEFSADYSYADGWPLGFAPEIANPSTFVFLSKILDTNADLASSAVRRDVLFSVLEKDINSFDIETEISDVDYRRYRLTLASDSERNLLLLQRFYSCASLNTPRDADSISDADRATRMDEICKIILAKPEILRTLPAFYSVQVTDQCPQQCVICPYPEISKGLSKKQEMSVSDFDKLMDKIVEFSSDAVIDLSLWGEIALHPFKIELIDSVLKRPSLSLVIETCGIGWRDGELERIADIFSSAKPRFNGMSALSLIVSLDGIDEASYKKLRGDGFTEAFATAKKIFALFGKNAYIQTVRIKGSELDTEKFYRYWAETEKANVIVQKYDDFCAAMPALRAADLSPIKRLPCNHIMRDMSILVDGTVPMCKEWTVSPIIGNVFTEPLSEIWERNEAVYKKHCTGEYPEICTHCDEYWTFNF
ncbi:MAG: spiro-SPASM protein [Termitinemataceae bacterium]|nr:MAG: spiro-SPASM protein [Termitinemataceae bacterium]